MNNGNFRILPDPDDLNAPAGVIIKQNFWLWPDRHIAGNAIDFFMKVENKSFQDAMRIITEWQHYDAAGQHLREERGNQPEILR